MTLPDIPRVRRYTGPDGNQRVIVMSDGRGTDPLDSVEVEELERKILYSGKSANEIALLIGCSRRTVQRHRRRLRAEGKLPS